MQIAPDESGAPERLVVILGAGPAGLATGHGLSKEGVRVVVLERNAHVGGLCVTVEREDFRFDLGGHRWFTKNADLDAWFHRLMAGELVAVNRISRIYHQGRLFDYPISFGNVMSNAHAVTVVHAGASYLWEQLRRVVLNPPVRNMHDAYRRQFGQKLYEMFFEQYSEKVWGAPCDQLSADWVTQRSKGLSILSVVANALFQSKEKKAKSLIEEFFYPRFGYMRIAERMAEDIQAHGGEIRLATTVTGVVAHGPNEFEVRYTQDGKQHSLRADDVVSTIPLGLLTQMIAPKAPDAVIEAARRMRFRDIITVNLMLNRSQVTSDTWVYVQDRSILFGRLHEPKNWSPDMVPDASRTSLVLECFCTVGDTIWSLSDEEIIARCVDDLVDKLGFISRSDVAGAFATRARHAYPAYDLDYKQNIDTVNAYLRGFPGLEIVGRGGAFRYNNADHSIEMGLILAQKLLGMDVDHTDVNIDPEYHEIVSTKPVRRHAIRQSSEAELETLSS
jgi:protoporphyrinogen oxidase